MNIDQEKIAALLARMHLPAGLGDHENACSIAAINLALTGELTDDIPECMSKVIGRWIIVTQDAMPDVLRNSAEWKRLLPLAAGTGRTHEPERLALILSHMWTVALPLVQPVADAQGFGAAWNTMLTKKTAAEAEAASEAASEAMSEAAWAEAAAIEAAWAEVAARAEAARATSAAWAARAAVRAAAARAQAEAARAAEVWEILDPCKLLADLIAAPYRLG